MSPNQQDIIVKEFDIQWGVPGLILYAQVVDNAGIVQVARTYANICEKIPGSGLYQIIFPYFNETWQGKVIIDDNAGAKAEIPFGQQITGQPTPVSSPSISSGMQVTRRTTSSTIGGQKSTLLNSAGLSGGLTTGIAINNEK